MKFRTELNISPSSCKINHKAKVLTLGSCFADVTGSRFTFYKFATCNNPFGTLFNPLSVASWLEKAVKNEAPTENGYLETRDVFLHYQTHSSLYGNTLEGLKNLLQKKLIIVREYVYTGNLIIITLGTAWVYRLNSTGETVANCHKMPTHLFTKDLLTEKEITEALSKAFQVIHQVNPSTRVILTVSPVRHIKDTLTLNSVSKSTLRLAAHNLENSFPFVEYFPAYELLLDDLRDYRFYKDDLIHPTPFAEEYIWENFSKKYFAEETRTLNSQWLSLEKNFHHNPLQQGKQYKSFLQNTLLQLQDLQNKLSVDEEIKIIENKLDSLEN